MYVSISHPEMVVKDHSYGVMISYAGERHERASRIMGNQVGRVASTNL